MIVNQMCNPSLIICLSVLLSCAKTIYFGAFAASQSIFEFTYTTITTAPLVNFQLYLTPFYSAALLLGRSAPFNVSTNREDWIHFDYLSDSSCDFEGMVTGRNQYAFANNNGIGTVIYMKLVNFEPANTFTYTINITEGPTFLQTCPVGLIRQTAAQYCQFCDFGHVGAYCNIARHSISPSSQAFINLSPSSFTYFILLTQAEITLFLTFANGLMVFIQTQTETGEIAGITNFLFPTLGQGKFVYANGSSVSIDLPSIKASYLIGVINPHSTSVSFTLLFNEKEGVNALMIIVGVIGGILFLGLVITTIVILRRLSNRRREVLPYGMVPTRQRSNKLNTEEINFYFPEVALQDFYPPSDFQASKTYLKQQKLEGSEGVQCVICLCPIESEEMARAGYCKHVFHSQCLVQWFRKQQNCPYCRENYQRDTTKQLYQKLALRVGKKIRGLEILKHIFAKPDQMTMNTIEITDISGEAYCE